MYLLISSYILSPHFFQNGGNDNENQKKKKKEMVITRFFHLISGLEGNFFKIWKCKDIFVYTYIYDFDEIFANKIDLSLGS